jgi:metallo-beta-lactamase class B
MRPAAAVIRAPAMLVRCLDNSGEAGYSPSLTRNMPKDTSHIILVAVFAALAAAAPLACAQNEPGSCPKCSEWNAPQAPFRIFANTYYVGTRGISSILITSPQGHVLIDGCIGAAPQIVEHIRRLGFRIEDVKWIGNSHVHYDHSGSLAEFQRLSGAQVAASPWSVDVLTRSGIGKDDPQYREGHPTPLVHGAHVLRDGESLRIGGLAVTARFTPGHTPGGTSWTWQSCEGERCLSIIYADSMTAISSDDYRFSDHRDALEGFQKSFAFLRAASCDLLLTPHPELSDLWQRLERRNKGESDAMIDTKACKALAERSEDQLRQRLASEQKSSQSRAAEPRPAPARR